MPSFLRLESRLTDGSGPLHSFVPGAGATEMALATRLLKHADTLPGLEQYAVRKFALALESVPRALADNTGADATALVNKLYKAHRVSIQARCSLHPLNAKTN